MSFFDSLRSRVLPIVTCLGLVTACSSDPDKAADANTLVSNDFESLMGWTGPTPSPSLTEEKAHSGRYSIKVDGNTEYSLGFRSSLGAMHDVRIKKIKVSGWVFIPNAEATAVLVTHAGNANAAPETKPLLWDGFDIIGAAGGKYNQWVEVSKVIDIPETATSDTNIGFYLWRNKASNQPVYLDDFTVTMEPGG